MFWCRWCSGGRMTSDQGMDRRLHTHSDVIRWLARIGALTLLLHAACSSPSGVGDGGPPLDIDADMASDAGVASVDGGALPFAGCESPDANREACCVDSPSTSCCNPNTRPIALDTRSCSDGQELGACTEAPVQVFGTNAPTVLADGNVVGGSGPNFSGLALGNGFDPRGTNGTLNTWVDVPDMRCRDECIDVVGVTFLDRVPQGFEEARVRFGVLINGSRNRVQVIEGGEVVQTYNLSAGEFEIRSRIDGTFEADIPSTEGERRYTTRLEPGERLVPAVITRNEDPGPEGFVTLQSARFTSQTCDAPRAITSDETPALPSVDGRPAVLFREDGSLSVFVTNNGAIERVDRDTGGALGAASVALSPDANETFEDPWLVEHGDNLWLYAMQTDGIGERALVRVPAQAGEVFDRADLEVLVRPTDELPGILDLHSPSVVEREEQLAIYAQAELDGGGNALVELRTADGVQWVHVRTLREPRPDDLYGFERDEVADPAVVHAGGLYRLYFAGRQGTRWTIALMVSPDLSNWYDVGPVLSPDDEGYDALAVRGPAPYVNTGDRVSLYYVASDGVLPVLGLATP